MAKCQPKKKKAKKDVLTVNFNYDGLFTSCPMIYFQGEMRVLTDMNFDEMSYEHLLEIVKSYDIMEMVEFDRNEELRKNRIKAELECSDDDYDYSDDDLEQIDNVDFHTKGDDSVVIKNISTQDPFLTKLCSYRVLFKGNVDSEVDQETLQVDPDDSQIDSVYKLWYMKNDWRQVLVYCGRNVVQERCEGKKGNKHRVIPKKVRPCLFRGIQGNQAGKKVVKKAVKKDDKKKPVT
ncbi:hypothetical protein Tco_0315699 [Tanacetum coccineum]